MAAILDQTRYIAMADGTVTPAEQAQIGEAQKLVDTVRALTPEDAKSPKPIFGAPASYWLDLRGDDPPADATNVKQPMLLLQLNHLFIAGAGKSLPAECETAGHVDEAVVRDIAEWIKK